MKIFYGSAATDKDDEIVQAHAHSVWCYATRKPDAGLFLVVDRPYSDRVEGSEGLAFEGFCAPHPDHTHRSCRAGNAEGARKYNERIAAIRNQLIEAFLESDCDYLWFNDADQIMWPDVLERLVSSASKDRWDMNGIEEPLAAIAAPVRTSTARCWNCLYIDGESTKRPKWDTFGRGPRYGGTESVGVTGGCWLVPRLVLEAGARYEDHPLGTDAGFCLQLRHLSCPIYMDFSCRTFHHMQPDQPPLYSHDLEDHSHEQ